MGLCPRELPAGPNPPSIVLSASPNPLHYFPRRFHLVPRQPVTEVKKGTERRKNRRTRLGSPSLRPTPMLLAKEPPLSLYSSSRQPLPTAAPAASAIKGSKSYHWFPQLIPNLSAYKSQLQPSRAGRRGCWAAKSG